MFRPVIKTRILLMSDTHGQDFNRPLSRNGERVDVVIHCGDLTEHSKLNEFETTLQLIADIDAPLKLVIPDNHDLSLDTDIFRQRIAEAKRISEGRINDELVRKEYGSEDDVKRLFDEAADKAIRLLDEGKHIFTLENGARLKVYASPYTPCPSGVDPTWGFQYRRNDGHRFAIKDRTDIAVTHSPPRGIFDTDAEKARQGCPHLFAAVAKARPKVHFFGHIHNGWGAMTVARRDNVSENPSHLSDIDHERSTPIHTLAKFREERGRGELEQTCGASYPNSNSGSTKRTLFVNAAAQGQEGLGQPPWIVDIDLKVAGD